MNKWADMWESYVAQGKSPDEATALVKQAQAQESQGGGGLSALETVGLGARQVARGATLGLSDIAESGIRALSPNVTYAQARKQVDAGNKQFAEENPVSNFALNVGGAILPTLMSGGAGGAATVARMAPAALVEKGAARIAARLIPEASKDAGMLMRGGAAIARPAVAGAVAGSAGSAGYATGEDSAGWEALKGGMAGGLFGGAAGAIAPMARGTGSVLSDILGLRNLGKGVPEGQVPVAPNMRSVKERAKSLLPIPDNFSRRADEKVANAVTRGGKDAIDDVRTTLRNNNALTDDQAMVADLGGKYGERLFRGAKNKNVDATDVMERGFRARDKKLLSGFANDLSTLTGQPINTVQARRDLAREATAIGDAGMPPIKDATFKVPGEVRQRMLSQDPRGVLRAVHKKAQKLSLETDGTPIPDLYVKLPDGSFGLTDREMSVREADYMRRALQEMVDAKAAGGKGIGKLTARNMSQRLDEIVGAADAGVPEYSDVRGAIREKKSQINAIDNAQKGGRRFGTNERIPSFKSATRNDVEDIMGRMNPTDAEAYRTGVGASLYTDAAKNPRRVVRDIARNEETQNKLRAADQTPDKVLANSLIDRTVARDEQVQKFNDIMRGSITNESMNDPAASQMVGNLGQFVYAKGRALGKQLAGEGLMGLQGKVAGEIGNRAALKGAKADDFLKYLMDLDSFNTARSATRGSAGRSALAAILGLQ